MCCDCLPAPAGQLITTCAGFSAVFVAQDLDLGFNEVAGALHPCEHATALCTALLVDEFGQPCGELWQLCGDDALERLLHSGERGAPEISDGVLTACISVCRQELLAVRLADCSWGLVANYFPMAAGRLHCLLCKKNYCPHTSALDAGEGSI